MIRLPPPLLALAIAVAVCSCTTDNAASAVDVVKAEARSEEPGTASQAADPSDETAQPVPFLLPDPDRWAVIWDRSEGGGFRLEVAPLEGGVPQLSRTAQLGYRTGPIKDFERQWGDRSVLGEPLDFETGSGVGRSVSAPDWSAAEALVWSSGMYVSISSMYATVDPAEVAMSLVAVDEATWDAARAGAPDQRLVALEAAMSSVEPAASPNEPLPHWVLAEPWRPEWVTDKTIWTAEQHAQSAALHETYYVPPIVGSEPTGFRLWHYGFGATAEEAAAQFVPEFAVAVKVFEGTPDPLDSARYGQVSALGLDGAISRIDPAGAFADFGTGDLRVTVYSRSLGEDSIRDFLDSVDFATDDPLDGLIVDDPRFQPIPLPRPDDGDGGGDGPPSWHASWVHPDGAQARVSVQRMTVPELRMWLMERPVPVDMPSDIWEIVAAEGTVVFGAGETYDAATGIWMSVRGVAREELEPIELDQWIALVQPVNTDPLNPR